MAETSAEMAWNEKRRRAEDRLNRNASLWDMLERTGYVRVAIPVDLGPYQPPGSEFVCETIPIATFTIERTPSGPRLMVEIDGRKEFVA